MHRPRWSKDFFPVITCPYRFLEGNIVFNFIKEKFFKGKKIAITDEVSIDPFGTVDGFIGENIQDKGLQRVSQLIHLEYQADGTTGTRGIIECIKDFREGIDVTKNNYKYGMNSKASIKGASLQMINKGFLFEELQIPSIWILQDYLFTYLRRTYKLKPEKITFDPRESLPKDKFLFFLVTKLTYNSEEEKFSLKLDKFCVTTPAEMQSSIEGKTHEVTIDLLKDKFRQKIKKSKCKII